MLKKILLSAMLVGIASYSYGQGNIVLKTFSSPTVKTGKVFTDSTLTAGCSGTAYFMQIFAADGQNVSNESLLQAKGSAINFLTGASAGWVSSVNSTTITTMTGDSTTSGANPAPDSNPSGYVTLQLRAWSSSYADYSAAATANAVGKSITFSLVPTWSPNNPPSTGLATLGSSLPNFFIPSGSVVPEPSTIALGVIGAAALLFRRRK